jgi:hypothetical protein
LNDEMAQSAWVTMTRGKARDCRTLPERALMPG